MRRFGQGVAFRIDLNRPHEAKPQEIGLEGEAGLLDEKMSKPARRKMDSIRRTIEVQGLIEVTRGIVDDALDSKIIEPRFRPGCDRLGHPLPGREQGRIVGMRVEGRAKLLGPGSEARPFDRDQLAFAEQGGGEPSSQATFRLDEDEREQATGLDPVNAIRRHRDRGRPDESILVRQGELALEAESDLKRVMGVEIGIAESLGRIEHP